uniref:Uncharacterized protein n=1 Tax=Romanomermis culicivorax TaxID=13658 RepID=A0A915JZJ2_ROMCU
MVLGIPINGTATEPMKNDGSYHITPLLFFILAPFQVANSDYNPCEKIEQTVRLVFRADLRFYISFRCFPFQIEWGYKLF